MNTGLFIAASVALLSLSLLSGARFPRSWLALFLGGAALSLLAAVGPLMTGSEWTWRSGFEVGGEPVRLRLDALSAWFLVPLAMVGAAGAAYSREYWSDAEQPGSAGRGRVGWSALALSMTLVLLAADGLHFLIFWEAFALAGWVLITLEREHLETRAAGWLYLGASHAGTLGLFAFFALLSARTGGWDWGPMRDRPELAPLFWIALFGFGVKAGMFPLHIWLPSAHATAPSHVSALFSGMAIKLGLYGILRTTQWLPLPAGAGWVLLGLGAVSVVFGAASALGQADLKRLLAYCSVENIGVILVGWGAALLALDAPGAAWGGLAAAGALLHVWNHAFFKSLLFLGAGSVLHATGTREMSRLGGLWKTMPWTTCLFAFGAVAISALPPLNGLVSEFLIYLGLLEASAEHGRAALGALPATIALGVAGALALAAFVKAGGIVFLGASRTRAAAEAHESGWWMRAPMVGLGAACLLLALAPATAWPALDSVVRSWNPAWGASTAPAPLVTLGHFQRVLALLLLAGAIALMLRSKFNGLRRAATWDCGYAAPTARIQYTAHSFSSMALGWFGRVLRPQTRLRRPRGPFPNESDHSETLPDAVLEHAFRPLATAVMSASGWVRQRQHGHLPEYILYLVAALAAVTAVIVLGSLR